MLVLSGLLLLIAAGSAGAQDDAKPVVVVPKDIPGADVIVFYGDSYTFDVSQSYDDEGISFFLIDFKDGGNPVELYTDTGVIDYTFNSWGQTWVTVKATDWSGNEGKGYFSIDVVERITTDRTYADTTLVLDHSLYFDHANVDIERSQVQFGDGAGGSPAGGGAGAPDQLGESATPSGDLGGYWAPYYYNYYGNNYGNVFEDYNTKFDGQLSIGMQNPNWGDYEGWEYHFNNYVDLSQYNTLTFWFRESSYYGNWMNIYFYGDDYYSWPYTGTTNVVCYDTAQNGWYGVSVSLDFNNVGYYWGDGYLGSVKCFQIQYYSYGYYGPQWIDHIGFSQAKYADDITEEPSPSGAKAGYWSGGWGVSQSSMHYVGDYSVAIYLPAYEGTTISYWFNDPQDLSKADALRMFTWWPDWALYWWGDFEVFFAGGGVAYFSNCYYINYEAYYYGHWGLLSLPWGPKAGMNYGYGVDWTQVTGFELYYLYPYQYTDFYIDGLEWVSAGGGGGKSDTVPLAIYTDQGDMTIKDHSFVQGGSKTGARLDCNGGTGTFKDSTFDNLWATQYGGVENSHNTYGGIEVYGDSVVKNVRFQNCKGPGLALFDGTMNLDPTTIDLTGTAQKIKGSPMMILGATGDAVNPVSIDVSGWSLANSPTGSGLMIMLDRATVPVDVTITGNTIERDGYDSLIFSNWGGACPLSVKIYNQTISESGNNAIVYWAQYGDWSPTTTATFDLNNVSVTKSAKDSVVWDLLPGASNLDVKMVNSTVTSNDANGIDHLANGFFGNAKFDYFNVTVADNDGDGMYFYADMLPWEDADHNPISPVGHMDVNIDSCIVKGQSGVGIREEFNVQDGQSGGVSPPWQWSGETRSTLYFNATVYGLVLSENAGGGWYSSPDDKIQYGNFFGDRTLRNCTIEDNRGPAFYIAPVCDISGTKDAQVTDIWTLTGCFINDNVQGVIENLGAYNYGYYSEIHMTACHVEGQDAEAIWVYGSEVSDGIHTWGISDVLGAMVYVDGCRFNSPVKFELMGATDMGRADWSAKMGVQFTNNIVDVEEDVVYKLGSDPNCERFLAWGDVGNDKFYKKIVTDGFGLDIYGGHNTNIDFTVRDENIASSPGSGMRIVIGSLWSGFDAHQLSGTIRLSNITITGSAWNGINMTVDNAQPIGAKNRATLTATGLTIDGAVVGIYSSDMIGKIYLSTISHCSAQSVFISYSVYDFYGCDVGPMTTDNIRVMTKGAARMWFDVSVDVKWASGQRVKGAIVSMEDNTFATIGVTTMGASEPAPFGYVNSYTILPDSVYAKSPFIIGATYLGLSTQKLVDITANTVIELVLVDDVMPRLTVTTPADGSEQTSLDIEVKGFAWDLHSGLDKVLVSINGEDWFTATGTQEFNYTFKNVPEGQVIVSVKALDFAGNVKEEQVAVLVDATPPVIQIIEPKVDVFSTNDPVLKVIGVTEMGATVTVADVRVPLDMTLFSTQVALREGPNEVRVAAADHLGNTAVHVIRVTLDTIPPPLIVLEPASDAVLGKAKVSVSGQTEDGAMVRINGAPVANIGGLFRGTTSLLEGSNIIIVEAQDAIGNVRTVRVPVVIDTISPWVSIVSPVQGNVYGAAGIPVDGWTEAGVKVTVNDRSLSVTNGHFMHTVFGSEGAFTVSITATDLAGNEVTKTFTVTVDTTAPTIALESPKDGDITSADYMMLVGTLSWDRETFREISLTLNGGFLPFSAEGAFRERVALNEGTNPLTLVATDDVGNARTVHLTVVRDSTQPFLLADLTPTFMHPVWNKPATYNALVYIEGDTEPGATVTVDGADIDVDPSGHFNVSLALPAVPSGQELVHVAIQVVAKDAAGNTREQDLDIYRIKEAAAKKGLAKYEGAQWWALILSVVILVMAIVTAWLLLRASERDRMREEEIDAAMAEGGR